MTSEQMVMVIVALILGFLGKPLTDFLKETWHIEDRSAVALSAFVSLLLAIVQLFFANQLRPDMFTVEQFPQTFGLIYSTAAIIFSWFKKRPNDMSEFAASNRSEK